MLKNCSHILPVAKIKCSTKICSILLIFLIHGTIVISKEANWVGDDLYGEELDNVVEVFNRSEKLYKTKHADYFTGDYFEKIDAAEIPKHAGNLMGADEKATKSFRRLNAIANNYVDGDKKLKSDGTLKNSLKVMLNDNKMKPKFRVDAAKLTSRLNDMPVTIQMTADDPNKKPKNFDSYIVVPRIKRIYRPDYYVENYKAGNWDA